LPPRTGDLWSRPSTVPSIEIQPQGAFEMPGKSFLDTNDPRFRDPESIAQQIARMNWEENPNDPVRIRKFARAFGKRPARDDVFRNPELRDNPDMRKYLEGFEKEERSRRKAERRSTYDHIPSPDDPRLRRPESVEGKRARMEWEEDPGNPEKQSAFAQKFGRHPNLSDVLYSPNYRNNPAMLRYLESLNAMGKIPSAEEYPRGDSEEDRLRREMNFLAGRRERRRTRGDTNRISNEINEVKRGALRKGRRDEFIFGEWDGVIAPGVGERTGEWARKLVGNTGYQIEDPHLKSKGLRAGFKSS